MPRASRVPCAWARSSGAGIHRVVYAASVAEHATKIGQIDITCRQMADATPFANIDIAGGLLSANAMQLFDK
jgi:hypothetical protein